MCEAHIAFYMYVRYIRTHHYYSYYYESIEKHTTALAAVEMIDRITQELDKGNTPLNICVSRFIKGGTASPSLRLLRSYLSNRIIC